jgi:phosphoribosyl 1,2-cyclic phosphate phosphodiesterase
LRITILGSGTSHGVPAIGCECPVCLSADPRDRRLRCSIVVEAGGRALLVDTPPELRLQALRSSIRRVDALLYTHTHADHLFGLDDVRRFNEMQGGDLPVYGSDETLADVRRSYRYVFVPTQAGGGKPQLRLLPLEREEFTVAGIPVRAVPVLHGRLPVLGFRIGDFAYVTDVSLVPDPSRERLHGLDTLVLGALRWEPHPTHFTIDQAIAFAREIGPRRTFLTHLAHNVPHAETERKLPKGVRLAYDGLVLEVPDPALVRGTEDLA